MDYSGVPGTISCSPFYRKNVQHGNGDDQMMGVLLQESYICNRNRSWLEWTVIVKLLPWKGEGEHRMQ